MSHRWVISILASLLIGLSLSLTTAWAHGGGRDVYGCHHDRKHGGYHCHEGLLAGRSFASQQAMLTALEALHHREKRAAPDVTVKRRSPRSAEAKDPQHCEHDARTFRCVHYVRNYDGDTITFSIPHVHPIIGENISVRLAGVDIPEIRGKTACEKEKALEAKRFVERTLKDARRIDLIDVQKDKYFRLLSRIRFDNQDLTDMLIAKGYGYPYDGGTKRRVDWCRPLELADKLGE